jgi:6-phosphogluconolactonase
VIRSGSAVVIEESPEAATEAALREWISATKTATAERRCRVLLAGGSTPVKLYRKLADPTSFPPDRWTGLELFFGDERCVPPDHRDSNFGMVRRALLEPLGEKAPLVHRIRGEEEPERAAREYESAFRRAFALSPGETPSFDLALLGVGVDGHTASLFPGDQAGFDRNRLVVSTKHPRDGSDRVTVTYELLDHARRVAFLAVGSEKAEAVARSLSADGSESDATPAGRIRPVSREVVWILDRDAARRIA